MTASAPPRPERGGGGAVDRVDRDVGLRRRAVADPLAVEEHRGVVLLALADHHHAVHRHGRSTTRMALTAAPSAPSLSPRPIHRLAAMAAASVTRTSSMARLRSGAWRLASPRAQTLAGCRRRRSRRLPGQAPGRPGSPGRYRAGRHTGPVDRFVIRPNGPLSGTIRAGGAKNSALKLMAACLLAEGRHVLANVPRITDVDIMAEVLGALGARSNGARRATWSSTRRRPTALVPEAPYELVERMRASVVVLGPLLARCGHARVSMPGGDDFGNRPIDYPPQRPVGAMGARFETAHGYVEGRVGAAGRAQPPAGWSATAGRARVPEPHRHRQPADGGRAGQRHHRHRERGPRARDLRPGRLPQLDGGRASGAPAPHASRSRGSRRCSRHATP